jgi:hypothetical protein
MKKIFFLTMLLGLYLNAKSQQVVDLRTGVYNNTNTLIPNNVNDDTWTVSVGVTSTYVPVKRATHPQWDMPSVDPITNVGRVTWVSPFVNSSGAALTTTDGNILSPSGHHIGKNYMYKMTFVANNCTVDNAVIHLYEFGGDNSMLEIWVNNNFHTAVSNHLSLSSGSVVIPSSEIYPGVTNTIKILVHNNDTYTGLCVDGRLFINYASDPSLVPSITSASSFCNGDQLFFSGSDGPGLSDSHIWDMEQCDAMGNPVPGGYAAQSPNFWGTPGVYVFPNPHGLSCNTYYRIKLTLFKACYNDVSITKIIYVKCAPVANAGPDVTICKGSCTTLGGNSTLGRDITYQWVMTVGSLNVNVGTTRQITVCPTMNTLYTLTVTDQATGCSKTDQVYVFLQDNDPKFTVTKALDPSGQFFTVNATPVVNPMPAGSNFNWTVERVNSPTNPAVIGTGVTSSCWWTTINCNFHAYDATFSPPLEDNINCLSPSVGKFDADHTYRITRGTWSSVCPWQQYSVFVYVVSSFVGNVIVVEEDPNAPDYSYTMPASIESSEKEEMYSVYPNPSNGIFNLIYAEEGVLTVFDQQGKLVQTKALKAEETIQLDLSGYSKGIYLLNFVSENKQVSRKIILE